MTPARRLRSFICASVAATALALAISACGGSNDSTSAQPTVTAGPQTELFEGKLAVGGSAFYSFTVQATGNTNVMLASVMTSTAPGTSTGTPLGLAIGSPLGTDCNITTAVVAGPALQSPLVSNLTAGTYCVRVYDVGNLTVPVNFAVRIVHT
jgi:hypothetical protein